MAERLVPKSRPPLSRPIGRHRDPMARLGEVDVETPAQARRRRQRERSLEVAERAEYLLDNDPDIDTEAEARRAAREQLAAEREYEAGVKKGTVDPDTGRTKDDEPTKDDKPRRSTRGTRPGGATRAKHRSHRSSRPSRRAARFARKTARAVVEPYGSVGAAGWTLVTGSLSVILLYVLLQEAGTVKAFTNAITGGIRRFADPFMPLIPTAGESAPPPPKKKNVTGAAHKSRPVGINAAERR